MGLDLTVMASHFRERRGELLPTATLRFDRNVALFARLATDATPCLVHWLPDGLTVGVHGDAGLRFTSVDRYDRPLTCTTPEASAGWRCRATPPRGIVRSWRSWWHSRTTHASCCSGAHLHPSQARE